MDNQAEFKSYLERLGIEQPALCILLGVQRSTLNKWVNGTVTAIPAIATTAVKMLWFIKESESGAVPALDDDPGLWRASRVRDQ